MAFLPTSLPSFLSEEENRLYSAEQVRELDRRAIEDFSVPGIQLMKRAGKALFGQIVESWPEARHLSIFCGAGNNGGDGYIVAALAARKGMAVMLVETAGEKLTGDAKLARQNALEHGVAPIQVQAWLADPEIPETSVVVDALLGTGFKGELREPYDQLVEKINMSGLPVVAADIPSGLEADTGHVAGLAVEADLTVTFIGVKLGLFTGQGRAYCGEIVFANLEVPDAVYAGLAAKADTLNLHSELSKLPVRTATDHKGNNGHVLIVGGDYGFSGAPLMAAIAAARMGAGLVSAATRAEHCPTIVSSQPEIMACEARGEALDQLLEKATVIVIGPGLGTAAWGQGLFQKALQSGKPLVVDADALNLLSTGQFDACLPLDSSVFTPHPGEASRLLDVSTDEVNKDRPSAVQKLASRLGGAVLLKGSGTLIQVNDQLSLCPYGNPGMASGGMGDVLSGIIGGLMAQGVAGGDALKLGACLHAYAADSVAEMEGQRGLLATDLIDEARVLINELDGY